MPAILLTLILETQYHAHSNRVTVRVSVEADTIIGDAPEGKQSRYLVGKSRRAELNLKSQKFRGHGPLPQGYSRHPNRGHSPLLHGLFDDSEVGAFGG